MRQIVVTAIGRDRPGIVAAVCRVLYEAGGNLRDTSMTILSGEFAMILVVGIPRALDVPVLDRRFDLLRRDLAIELFVKELHEARPMPSGRPEDQQRDVFLVTVSGADQPGIVCRIAEAMARLDVNITDMETRVLAEDTAKPVYMMMMEVVPPARVDMAALTHELEALGRDLSVEVSVRALDAAAL
jgi:glycine cleavage system transcriptional repressor